MRLPPLLQTIIEAYAVGKGISVPEAIEEMTRKGLVGSGVLTPEQQRQAVAEIQLMDTVDAIVKRIKVVDDWKDDVSKTVFDEIQKNHLQDHTDATVGDELDRVHREIGKRIRKGLDADVVVNDAGHRKHGYISRKASSLIGRYTVLRRRGQAKSPEPVKDVKKEDEPA
jgi:hypothetical protein